MHGPAVATTKIGHETPVARVIRAFGAAKASAIVELTTDAIRKWDRPIAKGGGGGLIPARYQQTYLDHASKLGVSLTASDLIAHPRDAQSEQPHVRAREDVQ